MSPDYAYPGVNPTSPLQQGTVLSVYVYLMDQFLVLRTVDTQASLMNDLLASKERPVISGLLRGSLNRKLLKGPDTLHS